MKPFIIHSVFWLVPLKPSRPIRARASFSRPIRALAFCSRPMKCLRNTLGRSLTPIIHKIIITTHSIAGKRNVANQNTECINDSQWESCIFSQPIRRRAIVRKGCTGPLLVITFIIIIIIIIINYFYNDNNKLLLSSLTALRARSAVPPLALLRPGVHRIQAPRATRQSGNSCH